MLEAGTVGTGPDKTFGPVLLMETKVVDKLLLDLEGFATFLTLVPGAGTTKHEGDTQQPQCSYKEKILYYIQLLAERSK